ncbi:MAG: HAD family hydrolase, partial [Candidatus Woesearchaeota archaeon]
MTILSNKSDEVTRKETIHELKEDSNVTLNSNVNNDSNNNLKLSSKKNIKAILFDVYGTILRSDSGDLAQSLSKRSVLLNAARLVSNKYCMNRSPDEIVSAYENAISAEHHRKKSEGIQYPEVVLEDIWAQVCTSLGVTAGPLTELAYDFYDLTASRYLYDGVFEVLKELQKRGIRMGIISNAQRGTELDLLRLLKIDSLTTFFDKDLLFFSYRLGYSKPNLNAFRLALSHLHEKGILPSEVLFVGNS